VADAPLEKATKSNQVLAASFGRALALGLKVLEKPLDILCGNLVKGLIPEPRFEDSLEGRLPVHFRGVPQGLEPKPLRKSSIKTLGQGLDFSRLSGLEQFDPVEDSLLGSAVIPFSRARLVKPVGLEIPDAAPPEATAPVQAMDDPASVQNLVS